MHERYRDPLDLLTEADLRKEIPPPEPFVLDAYWEKFQYDLYDWNDPKWVAQMKRGKNAWRPIRLYMRRPGSINTKDVVLTNYFMAVSPKDYKRLTQRPDGSLIRWTLKTKYDELDPELVVKMYARSCGRGDEPNTIYPHRKILGCIYGDGLSGDHSNGWGLDNRRENLARVRTSENTTNAVRERKKNVGLPPGVEIRQNGKDGIRYGGTRRKRLSKKKVICIRSKRVWKTIEPAARWYANQLKRIFGRSDWAHTASSVTYPVFPPLRKQASKSRRKAAQPRVFDEIPF